MKDDINGFENKPAYNFGFTSAKGCMKFEWCCGERKFLRLRLDGLLVNWFVAVVGEFEGWIRRVVCG